MSLAESLAGYLKAYRPLIYIYGSDFESIDNVISDAEKNADRRKIEEYNNALGSVDFISKRPLTSLGEFGLDSSDCVTNLIRYLDTLIVDEQMTRLVVLKDVHHELADSRVVARLKMIAWHLSNSGSKGYAVQVIVVSSRKMIPLELEKIVTMLEMPNPSAEEVTPLIREVERSCNLTPLKSADLDDLSLALRGLSRSEIQSVLGYVLSKTHGSIAPREAIPIILREKKQIIQKSDLLEPIELDYGATDLRIGGLPNLIRYLRSKAEIFQNLSSAKRFGVGVPKGVLIVGMPGCGKSLAAKECARLFKAPLVRLDIGRLLGRYVGESEENLRRALRSAEAAMPCVLWVDEIEKAFAGAGREENGVTTRLFGQFLTWLQEKDKNESTVYVVATANDLSRIPPEFLRRGRFDEIFSVDLPGQEDRKEILRIHLEKRIPKQKMSGIDLNVIGNALRDGYSGADIEAIVKMAFESAFLRDSGKGHSSVGTQDILDSIAKTKPISETMGEKISALKECLRKYQVCSAS